MGERDDHMRALAAQDLHPAAGALDGGLDLKDQSSKDWTELFNAINRVVLVVPVPCDGSEYKPPKTALDAPQAAG